MDTLSSPDNFALHTLVHGEKAINRLSRTFAAQVEALKRYRSNAEQRITVQHVQVNDGGQAIVGTVSVVMRFATWLTVGHGSVDRADDTRRFIGNIHLSPQIRRQYPLDQA